MSKLSSSCYYNLASAVQYTTNGNNCPSLFLYVNKLTVNKNWYCQFIVHRWCSYKNCCIAWLQFGTFHLLCFKCFPMLAFQLQIKCKHNFCKYYGCHNSNHNGQTDGHWCYKTTASINFQHVFISLNISFPWKKICFWLQQQFCKNPSLVVVNVHYQAHFSWNHLQMHRTWTCTWAYTVLFASCMLNRIQALLQHSLPQQSPIAN